MTLCLVANYVISYWEDGYICTSKCDARFMVHAIFRRIMEHGNYIIPFTIIPRHLILFISCRGCLQNKIMFLQWQHETVHVEYFIRQKPYWGLVMHICISELLHHWCGAKPLPEPVVTYCKFCRQKNLQLNLNQSANFFREETFITVICKMSTCM